MKNHTIIACTIVVAALAAGCVDGLGGPYVGNSLPSPLPECAGSPSNGVGWVLNGSLAGYEQDLEIRVGESRTLSAIFDKPDRCLPMRPVHYRYMSMRHGKAIGAELVSCSSCRVTFNGPLQILAIADTFQAVELRISGLTPGRTEVWMAGCTSEYWDGNENLPCAGVRSYARATINVRP